MKVYVSREEEMYYEFLNEENYYYYDIPREVDKQDYIEYIKAREVFKKAYQKVANHWTSLREEP